MRLIELNCPDCSGVLEKNGETELSCRYCKKQFVLDEYYSIAKPFRPKKYKENNKKTKTTKTTKSRNANKAAKSTRKPLTAFDIFCIIVFFVVSGFTISTFVDIAKNAHNKIGALVTDVVETQAEVTYKKNDFVVIPGVNLSTSLWYSEAMTPMEEVLARLMEQLYDKSYHALTLDDWNSLTELTLDEREDGLFAIAIINGEERTANTHGSAQSVQHFIWAFSNITRLSGDFGTGSDTSLINLKHLTTVNYNYSASLEDVIEQFTYPENITELTGVDIRGSVENLHRLKNLKTFSADIFEFTDLTKLGTLTSLETLELKVFDGCNNLDVIGNLTNLKHLKINAGDLYSIDFLANLTNLETLEISGGKFRSIDVLEKLPNLNTCILEYCGEYIENYDVIDRLTGIENLYIDQTWRR